jgi:hypothetical protein
MAVESELRCLGTSLGSSTDSRRSEAPLAERRRQDLPQVKDSRMSHRHSKHGFRPTAESWSRFANAGVRGPYRHKLSLHYAVPLWPIFGGKTPGRTGPPRSSFQLRRVSSRTPDAPAEPGKFTGLAQPAMRSTILPRLRGAPASNSWAVRTSSNGSTVPTSVTSLPLSNSCAILFRRSVVASA